MSNPWFLWHQTLLQIWVPIWVPAFRYTICSDSKSELEVNFLSGYHFLLNCELCESVPVGIVLKWKCCRGVWLLCHGHMEPSQFPCEASASVSLTDSTLEVDLFINQYFNLLPLTKILIMGLMILNVSWKFTVPRYELGLPSNQIPKLKVFPPSKTL